MFNSPDSSRLDIAARHALVTGVCILATTLTSCKAPQEEKKDEVAVTPLKLPITVVKKQELTEQLNLPGIVFALPDKSVKVSPAIAGKLTEVKASPGENVQKGQIIAVLDSRQLKDQANQAHARILVAKAAVEQAKTNLLLAQNTSERNQHLVEQDVGAQKDLVAAKSQVDTAKAQLLAAAAQVDDAVAAEESAKAQLSYTVIRSPISGLVAQRYLNVSDSTDSATPVVQIVDLSQVIVEASLPTTQPANLRIGAIASITAKALPGTKIPGTIQSVNPVTDNQGTTIGVRILCHNPQFALKEGLPVAVSITIGDHPTALTVPASALVSDPEDPEQKMVYVFNDGKITRTKVKTGITKNGSVEILRGLTSGQSIVAAGAYGVPDGTEVQPESGAIHATSQVSVTSN